LSWDRVGAEYLDFFVREKHENPTGDCLFLWWDEVIATTTNWLSFSKIDRKTTVNGCALKTVDKTKTQMLVFDRSRIYDEKSKKNLALKNVFGVIIL